MATVGKPVLNILVFEKKLLTKNSMLQDSENKSVFVPILFIIFFS